MLEHLLYVLQPQHFPSRHGIKYADMENMPREGNKNEIHLSGWVPYAPGCKSDLACLSSLALGGLSFLLAWGQCCRKKKKKNDMSSPGISKIIQILETGWKLESGTRTARQSCPVLVRESLVNLFLGDCEVWKVIHREILVMDSYDAVLLTASFSLKPVPGCGTTQPYLLPNKAASF